MPISILSGMLTVTTIKVERDVRDRLARVARARGVSLGALLDAESRRLEIEEQWAAIESAYACLQHEDPAGWTDYLHELHAVCIGESDSTAAEEWPEYQSLQPQR
jgi:hypothetical protein